MIDELKKVRQNYLAITLAAVACFLFEVAWYSFFIQDWLNGIGHTDEWLMATGVNPALQFATALLSAGVIAGTISCVTQLSGPQTALRGMRVAGLLWLGCILTTWATEYAFEVRTYKLFAINTGFWLIGMVIMGAIVGAWKKK
jgi:hypothetical protein